MRRDRAIAGETTSAKILVAVPVPLRWISIGDDIYVHGGGGLSRGGPLARGNGLGVIVPGATSITSGRGF